VRGVGGEWEGSVGSGGVGGEWEGSVGSGRGRWGVRGVGGEWEGSVGSGGLCNHDCYPQKLIFLSAFGP
jgi:hypothetical protein